MLDTNAYSIFFKQEDPRLYSNLVRKIGSGEIISFYISEITSMEIHSVLGKYRRGVSRQLQQCERKIIMGNNIEKCSNIWLSCEKKRIKDKFFRAMQRLVSDIEAQKGDIQATILKLDNNSIQRARNLLISYADRYNFGSHDALIAGSFISASESGMNLTLITSDRGLKAVLKEESMSLYDPLTPQSLTF